MKKLSGGSQRGFPGSGEVSGSLKREGPRGPRKVSRRVSGRFQGGDSRIQGMGSGTGLEGLKRHPTPHPPLQDLGTCEVKNLATVRMRLFWAYSGF